MYQAKNYEHLIGLQGMSEALLKNHFTLYQGYVTNANKLVDLLKAKEVGTPEYSELQRRLGWEWNGMRLHELYFENMTLDSKPLDESSLLGKKITEVFGSVENWTKNFKGIGTMRGIGWVMLVYDKEVNKLFNVWVNEHDVGHLAGVTPLLVMDVFEHSFMLDYGLKRADYIEAFWKNIDWDIVTTRLNA